MSRNYKHILIPLDGSELAELALEDGINLAELSGADVTLLQVVPPAEHVIGLDSAYPVYLDQQWETQKGLALDYLKDVHKRINGKEIKIDTAVVLGQSRRYDPRLHPRSSRRSDRHGHPRSLRRPPLGVWQRR